MYICIDSLYSLNRRLLLLVGLWPYQRSKLAQLQLILFIVILTSFIAFQLTVFVTLKCTLELLINVLSSALFCSIFTIKYISFSVNIENVKYVLDQIKQIYNELTDKNEVKIIEKYRSYAKRYTVTALWFTIFSAFVLIFYALWPQIYDFLFSKNGTVTRTSLPFITEYFVNQEEYFYLISCHANVSFLIGGFTMLATGTILISYVKHACGLFRIASYRIEQAMILETLQKNSVKSENLIYKGLICAVDMHRKAIKFTDSVKSIFNLMFFYLMVIGVIDTSITLFRILQMVSREINIAELLMYSIFLFAHLLYIILCNYFAQEIIDHNSNVSATVYTVRWYVAPLRVQKMILFLLQRSNKPYKLCFAGLIVGSLENAASLLSAVVSYFTIIYSTQH